MTQNRYIEDAKDEVDELGRKTKTFLVPYWQHAYKWLSMQAAALVIVLEAVKLWLSNNSGDLALMTQTSWYSFVVFGVTVAIPILRLVHQPIDQPVPNPLDAPTAKSATPPAGS